MSWLSGSRLPTQPAVARGRTRYGSDRPRRLARGAAEREFDLLVIGGGVIGAGFRVRGGGRRTFGRARRNRGDFGGCDVELVVEVDPRRAAVSAPRRRPPRSVLHEERRHLMNVVAPHLVHRLPFLFPLYRGGPYRPWVVQSGILFYSALAKSRLHWLVEPERARRAVPGLRTDGLRSCGALVDAGRTMRASPSRT